MFLKNENSQIKLIYSLLILSIGVSSFSQKTLRLDINMDYILENFDDFKQANQEYALNLINGEEKLKELKNWKNTMN